MRKAEPDYTLEQIAERLGVSRQELSYRMRFAEMSEDELADAVSKSWLRQERDSLPRTPRNARLSESLSHARLRPRRKGRGNCPDSSASRAPSRRALRAQNPPASGAGCLGNPRAARPTRRRGFAVVGAPALGELTSSHSEHPGREALPPVVERVGQREQQRAQVLVLHGITARAVDVDRASPMTVTSETAWTWEQRRDTASRRLGTHDSQAAHPMLR